MYSRRWEGLARRVGKGYSEFDWEYFFLEKRDISDCLLEKMWNKLDPRTCFEGLEGYQLVSDGSGGPPPDRRGFLGGGFGDDWDCPDHLFINADQFAAVGYSRGTLRMYLRIRLSLCDRTTRYTIFGSKESMSRLGLLTPKRCKPTDAINAFVDGVNSSRGSKPIIMSLLSWEEGDVKTKVYWHLM